MAAPAPAPAYQVSAEVWAQCENPECNKWRRLPPHTVVNETEPWYCRMNPDPQHNACHIPEASYNDEGIMIDLESNRAKELNLHGLLQAQETQQQGNTEGHAQQQGLPPVIVAGPQQIATMLQAKPKQKRKGRPKGAKNNAGVGGDPRQRMVSFADDDDFDLETGGTRRGRRPKEDDEAKGTAGHNARCLVHVLNSMVDKPFVPDRTKSGTAVSTLGRKVKAMRQVPVETPSWEAMSKMAGASAALACEYADVFSSLAMMNGQFDNEQRRSDVIKESSSVEMQLRIAAMLGAARGLTSISDGMTLQDRTEWDVLDDSGFVPIAAYLEQLQQQQQGGGGGG